MHLSHNWQASPWLPRHPHQCLAPFLRIGGLRDMRLGEASQSNNQAICFLKQKQNPTALKGLGVGTCILQDEGSCTGHHNMSSQGGCLAAQGLAWTPGLPCDEFKFEGTGSSAYCSGWEVPGAAPTKPCLLEPEPEAPPFSWLHPGQRITHSWLLRNATPQESNRVSLTSPVSDQHPGPSSCVIKSGEQSQAEP